MGPNVKLKCLLIFLAMGLSLVFCKSPGYIILAPNVFHVGLEETVAVTVTGVTRPVKVKFFLQEFPNRKTNFSHVEGLFASDKSGLLKIKVNPSDIPSHDTEYNQYLYLVATCNDPQLVFHKETKVLLSYRDKIVLVQTDKPIYTPKQTVKFRVMPLDFNLKPSKDKVNILIKNPQGILAQRWTNVSSDTGFITKALHLGDHSLIGNWTIAITYGYLNSQNTTVKFEVKEYVLPRFSLRIIGPSYVLPSAKRIHIAIVSKYTYGKPVIGSVMTRLTLTGKGETEIAFFVNTSKLNDGKVQLKIDTSLLKNHALRPWFPDGRRLRIDADVVEQATGARESAVDSSIYFVKTPFHLSYESTAMYFKPSMPYVIKIDVKYPNKRPASHLTVQISAKGTSDTGKPVNVMQKLNNQIRKHMKGNTDGEGRVEFILDVPRSVKDIEVEVETKDDRLGEANAAVKFRAKAYNSPSKRYLHIRPKKPKGIVGVVSMWDVFQNGNISSLTFMVLSRGRILLQVLTRPKDGVNVVSTFTFTVTKEMSPACRVLAYYVTKDNEVVADSAVMEVEERFPNKVRLTSPGKHAKKERPGMDYLIEVESTPGSRVGLLGVDESVYLLRNKNRLTKKKVFKDVKNLDLGCGVGPGKNNQDVFKNSGLMVITNGMDPPKERTDFGCSAPETKKRRKRSISEQEKKTCCLNGKLFSRASCTMRARFMAMNGASLECREVFLNCCRIAWNEKAPVVDKRQRQVFEQKNGFFGGGNEVDDIQSEQVRKYFPETWIFDEEVTGPDGRMMLPVTLPDTITTWVLQAISISNTSGFAMTSPSRITTFKNFFVSLSLPYSVQRGEQLSVVATIFNYGTEMSHFEVSLSGSREFCSTERPGDKTKPIALSVKANDAKSVTFPIVPIQLGKIPIQVSATRKIYGIEDDVGSDVVQKDLLVVPEGVERRFVHSLVLDPQGVLRDEKPTNQNVTTPAPTLKNARIVQDGQQINTVMLTVPSRAIPGSIKASIYLTGNLIGPVVTNLIKGGLENILRMPMGCGEQNMIFLAPNVYVLEYLTNTRQVTAEVETRAYRFIQQGYQQELGFRRTDKSFSAFGETRPGSTWLTAFVVKVFCAARKFDGIAIDDDLVCDSIKWLLSNQRLDGAFPEVHDLVHKSLLGGVHGDVAMTAFVLTALLECKCSSQNSDVNIRRAVQYLESELASLNKAHVLALTTYSLALAKSTLSSKANQRLFQMSSFDKDQNTRHWDIGGPALNVETAGYALLSQLHLGRLKHGGPIVKWLTEQRNAEGGFVSTQDTCVALQALAKYSEKTAGAQLDLRVSVTPEKDAIWRRTFHVEKSNALILRKVDITPFLGGELFIDSSGTGVGQMQIEILHNVPSSKNETCLFDLRVSVQEEFDGNKVSDDGLFIVGRSTRRAKRALRSRRKKKSKKCKKRKGKRRHCSKPASKKSPKKSNRNKKPKKNKRRNKKKKNQKKKEEKQKTQARAPDSLYVEACTRFRKPGKSGMTIMDIGIFTGFEPDEKSLIELKKNVQPTVDRFEISDRSIVLYISEVFSSKEFCAHFKVNRVFGVGAVQPVPIKVYDYYEPGDSCTKFYSPDVKSELRLGICKGEQCKCTQDGCSSCNIESLDVDHMLKKACRDHEFVFKGEIALVDEDGKGSRSWLNYFIIIQKIFRKLDNSKLKVGDHIEYKKRAGCRCPELRETGEYLFMGQEGNGKQYVLDKKTFVVPWEGKTHDERNMIVAFKARMNRGYTCPLR
ncbi:A.superbus venom factor 1-like [Actinia tenebrosa]|uniref:A.superbus venom factor 1-like n=1 Tax=Actinia tenebrosa TaxID=6105 RepID=A0A6P8ITE5_ACTTE|nr:A.superbus venom factor 1-like [Actinia tenebrosa]